MHSCLACLKYKKLPNWLRKVTDFYKQGRDGWGTRYNRARAWGLQIEQKQLYFMNTTYWQP
jgi:hypothetical protein